MKCSHGSSSGPANHGKWNPKPTSGALVQCAGPHSTSNGRQSPVDPSMWWWAKTDSRWRHARPDWGQDERPGRRQWRFIGLVATTGSILAGICQSLQCSSMMIGLLEGCWRFDCGPLAGPRGVVLGVQIDFRSSDNTHFLPSESY